MKQSMRHVLLYVKNIKYALKNVVYTFYFCERQLHKMKIGNRLRWDIFTMKKRNKMLYRNVTARWELVTYDSISINVSFWQNWLGMLKVSIGNSPNCLVSGNLLYDQMTNLV